MHTLRMPWSTYLNAIHGVLEGKGKVITVVGAGGNRDKGKRPIMAKEAARASDRVVITSDNPSFRRAAGHHQRHAGWSGHRGSERKRSASQTVKRLSARLVCWPKKEM
ncbi:glutamate ligase domain-containing protein [Bacteroides nordii]|uniref:glutamate ligase domain-containing protein n=1 Tax=Bacteroides nordii TaxID=291645 RepID=UPI003C6BDF15